MLRLETLGWDAFFENGFTVLNEPGLEVGRVAIESKRYYKIITMRGELTGEASGKLLHQAESSADLPKVGDWVAITMYEDEGKAIIHKVLARKTKFSRKVIGKKAEEQVIAANIDTVFIVQSLDETFSLRRIERFLTTAYEGGASPVVILNKADICNDVEAKVSEVLKVAKDTPVYAVSAVTGCGFEFIESLIKDGATIAFVGPSGVGKSTLINRIAGKELQKTGEVRAYDSKGRHTTTRRELIILPGGGVLIDTPGLREVQLWNADKGLNETFADIDELAISCRFSNCVHVTEAECAILEALESGEISEERYQSYLKLQNELAFLDKRRNLGSHLDHKKKVKQIYKEFKKTKKRG